MCDHIGEGFWYFSSRFQEMDYDIARRGIYECHEVPVAVLGYWADGPANVRGYTVTSMICIHCTHVRFARSFANDATSAADFGARVSLLHRYARYEAMLGHLAHRCCTGVAKSEVPVANVGGDRRAAWRFLRRLRRG